MVVAMVYCFQIFFCFNSEFVTDLGGGGRAVVFLQVREDMAEDEGHFIPILHGL